MTTDQETQEVEDQEGTPNLTNLFDQAIRSHMKDLRVFLPGIVTAVSGDRVSVQPCVRGAYADSAEAVIRDIRLCYPGSKAARFAFKVVPGDDVLIIFADRSLDEWDAAGGGVQVQALDPRTHDFSDAVAVPVNLTVGVSLGLLETIETLVGIFIDNAAHLILVTGTSGAASPLDPAIVTLLTTLKAQITAAKV
jgi:hypothetical protein